MRLLGIVAPSVAAVIAAGLLLAATSVRSEIPESVSKLQVVEIASNGSSAKIHEQASVYLDDVTNMELVSQVDGRATVDPNVQSGVQRFFADGFHSWRLANDAWPKGVWRYKTDYAVETNQLTAIGKLNENGLAIQMPEGLSDFSDPVLNFVLGDPMLCSVNGSEITCDGATAADGERWIAGTLITKEQQRRVEVYQAYFGSNDRTKRVERTICGWTKHWDEGPAWSKDLEQFGSAFVSMPIQLQPPERKTPIYVPHGLVRLKRNTSQSGLTAVYSDQTGKWVPDLTLATQAALQVVLPEEVLPFAASSIDVALDIKAPHRDVTLSLMLPDGPIQIAELKNPSVPWKATLTDPKILAAARNGTLDVTLGISERTDNRGSATVVSWQVDSLRFSFRGTVE